MKSTNIGSPRKVIVVFFIMAIVIASTVTFASAQIGLIDVSDIFGEDTDDASSLDAIPKESNFVARFDVDGLANDDTTNRIINSTSEEFLQNESADVEQIIKKSLLHVGSTHNVSDYDLGANDVNEVIVFGKVGLEGIGGDKYRGAVIDADITGDELTQIAYNTTNYNSSTYNNAELRNVSSGGYIATINEGIYVIGTEQSVKDSIDTILGSKESMNKDIIPEVSGDTYVHMVAYDMTTAFNTIDISNVTQAPVPNNASLTYTTDRDNNITVTMTFDSGGLSENVDILNNYSRMLVAENISTTSDVDTDETTIIIETTPQSFEDTINTITGIATKDTDQILNVPEKYQQNEIPE